MRCFVGMGADLRPVNLRKIKSKFYLLLDFKAQVVDGHIVLLQFINLCRGNVFKYTCVP